LKIVTNNSAIAVSNALSKNQRDMSIATERLSTGLRINSAADDAAGLAIASKMTSQINGLSQAIRNSNDAVGLLQTADAAAGQIESILQRMRELSLQSSSGTNGASDRSALNTEFQSLKYEISRIVTDVEWNSRTLLDGHGFPSPVNIQVGANQDQTVPIELGDLSTDSLGIIDSQSYYISHALNSPVMSVTTAAAIASTVPAITGVNTLDFSGLSLVEGDRITLTVTGGSEVQVIVGSDGLDAALTSAAASLASQTELFSAATSSNGVVTVTGLTDGSALTNISVALESQLSTPTTYSTHASSNPFYIETISPSIASTTPAITGVNTLDFSGLSLVEGDRITLTVTGGSEVQVIVGSDGLDAALTSAAASLASQTGLFSAATSSNGVVTVTGLTDGSALTNISVALESPVINLTYSPHSSSGPELSPSVVASSITTESIVRLDLGSWEQMGSTIDSTGYWAMSGSSISTANNGLTIAIGAPLEKVNSIEVGQVRVFDWDGLGWVQRGTDIYGSRDAENPSYQGNNFGSEVALSSDGQILVIMSPAAKNGLGETQVFEWNNDVWVQIGSDLPTTIDHVVTDVVVSGNGEMIATRRGSLGHNWIEIFGVSDGEWYKRDTIYSGPDKPYYGTSLDLSYDGSVLILGNPRDGGKQHHHGRVEVWDWSGSEMVKRAEDLTGSTFNFFGSDVAITPDGNTLVVGEPGDTPEDGKVFVFDWDGSGWIQRSTPIIPNQANMEQFGFNVDVSDDGFTIAASRNSITRAFVFDWNDVSWDIRDEAFGDGSVSASTVTMSLSGDGNKLFIANPHVYNTYENTSYTLAYGWPTETVSTVVSTSGISSLDFSGLSLVEGDRITLTVTGGSEVQVIVGSDGLDAALNSAAASLASQTGLFSAATSSNGVVTVTGLTDGSALTDISVALESSDTSIIYGTHASASPDFEEFITASIGSDVDGDGDADLVWADQQWTKLLLNDGAGNFTFDSNIQQNNRITSVALADVDSDGDADLVWADQQWTKLLLNDGAGNFTFDSNIQQNNRITSVALADVDSDGDADLVWADEQWTKLLLNDGAGNFTFDSNIKQNNTVSSVALADVDSDGDADLVWADQQWTKLLLNDGAGNFTFDSNIQQNNRITSVALADVDSDGDADLVWADQQWTKLLLNDGAGNFTFDSNIKQNNTVSSVALADVDSDGDADLVWADQQWTKLLLNDGAGNFTFDSNIKQNNTVSSVALADPISGVNTLDFSGLSLVEGDRITLTVTGGSEVQVIVGSDGLDAALTSAAASLASQTGLFSAATSSSGVVTVTGLTDGSALTDISVALESQLSTPTTYSTHASSSPIYTEAISPSIASTTSAITGVNTLDFSGLSLVEGDRITLTVTGGSEVQVIVGSDGLDAALTSAAASLASQTGLFSAATSSNGVVTVTGLTDGSALTNISVALESQLSTPTTYSTHASSNPFYIETISPSIASTTPAITGVNTLDFSGLSLVEGDRITLTVTGGSEVQVIVGSDGLDAALTSAAASLASQTELFSAATSSNGVVTVTGLTDGSALTNISVALESSIPSISLSNLSITSSDSSATLACIDQALTTISSLRSGYGASLNMLDHTVDYLQNSFQNALESRSRIEDTDYASETTQLARTKIIQDAATAMLVQANQQAKIVLDLIK
jgi:flagellin